MSAPTQQRGVEEEQLHPNTPKPPEMEKVPDTKTRAEIVAERGEKIRLIILPIVVVIMVLATVLYLRSTKLDDIEALNLEPSLLISSTLRHIELTLIVTAVVTVISVGLGILVTRSFARYISPAITLIANLGQAIPPVGLIVLIAVSGLFPNLGTPVIVLAVAIYGILPVLRNTILGIESVNPATIEAAKGIGMPGLRVLTKVELPLAVPYILAGLRTTLVLVVGTVTLGTFVAAGGLGDIISTGISLQRPPVLFTGALLTIALALLVDWVGGLVERFLTPKGLS